MKNKTIWCFSAFSGKMYEVLEEDTIHLNEGQIPLKNKPRLGCKKCYGRGYVGKNQTNMAYEICYCLQKQINFDIINSNNVKK
jgi:hypothetical protein